LPSPDLPRLKKTLLAHSHIVAQGGVILLPESGLMPAKSPSKESMPNGNQHANGKQTTSTEPSSSQSPSRSSTFSYAGYFVLSTQNVMQGILTAETTVTISGDPMDLDVGVAKAIKTTFIKFKAPKQPNSSIVRRIATTLEPKKKKKKGASLILFVVICCPGLCYVDIVDHVTNAKTFSSFVFYAWAR
jgi:hypothetical protein